MALKERGDIYDCKCEGRNPDCQICEGKGYYYQIPNSNKPQKKISDPSDPFPLFASDSSKADSENTYVKRQLEKYAKHLKHRRKRSEILVVPKRKKKEKVEDKQRKNIESLEKKQRKKRKRI
jgi:hypothetical protein